MIATAGKIMVAIPKNRETFFSDANTCSYTAGGTGSDNTGSFSGQNGGTYLDSKNSFARYQFSSAVITTTLTNNTTPISSALVFTSRSCPWFITQIGAAK